MIKRGSVFYSAAAAAAWSREEIFERLSSGENGLTEAEARLRLE